MKSYGVTIQMRRLQQYFSLCTDVSSPSQYFHMVLFIWYVVLTFESVDEILLWRDHSNRTSSAVLSHGTISFSAFYDTKFGNFVEFLLRPLV